MNEIIIREYLGNQIEFKMIDGEVYANANKMAEAFGNGQKLKDWKRSENTKRYIEALEKAEWKFSTIYIQSKIGGANGGETWIHEKLVLNFARYLSIEFELWCDEQISTLLREGEVKMPQLPQDYLSALKELVKTVEEKITLENQVKRLVHTGKLYTTTEIAKELGYKSAIIFNKELEERKIQYKVNGTWVLCARYAELNYVSIKQIELNNGSIIYDRKWTGLGRDFLLEEFGAKHLLENK